MAKHTGDAVNGDNRNDDKLFQPVNDQGDVTAYNQMFQDTWQQNLGRRGQAQGNGQEYARVQSEGQINARQGDADPRRQATERVQQQDKPNPYHDIPVGNYTVRVYNQSGIADVLNGNGSRVTRKTLQLDKPYTDLRIPNEVLRISSQDLTIERRDLQNRKFETVHPDGAKDHFNERGQITDRTYRNGVKDLFDEKNQNIVSPSAENLSATLSTHRSASSGSSRRSTRSSI